MAILVCVVTASADVAAHPTLDEGLNALAKGDVHTALKKFDEAERSGTATDDELAAIYWHRAHCFHALDKKREAAAALDALVSLRPLYAPDFTEVPPDFRALFMLSVRTWKEKQGPVIRAPELAESVVTIPLEGHTATAARVILLVRAKGQAAYAEVPLNIEQNRATGTLRSRELWQALQTSGQLEVVVEARNSQGVPVALLGDPLHPLEVTVTREHAEQVLQGLKPPESPGKVTAGAGPAAGNGAAHAASPPPPPTVPKTT
jgi:hypothetical protein